MVQPPPEAIDPARWLGREPEVTRRHWDILSFGPGRFMFRNREPVRPLHVLPTPPPGMAESHGGAQSGGNGDWSTTWRYESPSGADRRWLSITTVGPLYERGQPVDWNQTRALDQSTDTLWGRLAGKPPWEPHVADRRELELTLGARSFTGEMIRPNTGRPALQFVLRCPELFLFGGSHGLSMDELETQLSALADLSANPFLAEERERRLKAERMADMERQNPGMLAEWEKARQARKSVRLAAI